MGNAAAAAPRGTPAAPIDVVEVSPDSSLIESLTRGEVDIQVRTARAYPRVITQFQNYVKQMALLDVDTAASCFYALPRRDGENDRTIEGPSARFAEIVASAWGHMRIEGRIVEEQERFVVARGTAWDVQQNVIIAYEVRRRITNSKNRRYSDDMIGVTANAAASIAIRNAVLKVVPAPLWRPMWLEAKRTAIGDAQTLSKRRAEMLTYFQQMGVRKERVLAVVGAQSEADITLERLGELRGLATAIKEGDTDVDTAFPELRPGQGPVTMPQRSDVPAPPHAGAAAPTTGSPVAAAFPAAPPAPAPDPPITIVALEKRMTTGATPVPYWLAAFSNGVRGCAFSTTMGAALESAKERGVQFADVVTRKQGSYIYIEELIPAGAR